jgi:rubrerythrin
MPVTHGVASSSLVRTAKKFAINMANFFVTINSLLKKQSKKSNLFTIFAERYSINFCKYLFINMEQHYFKYLFSNQKAKIKLIRNLVVHGFHPLSGVNISPMKLKKKSNKNLQRINEGSDNESSRVVICKNCGKEFVGLYCPICGQEAKTDRLNFSSFIDSLFSGLTNISRGFGFTILNLFSRPGYMLDEFIKGKRIYFTKPFQMLFVLAAVYALLSQILAMETNLPGEDKIKMGKGSENITQLIESENENKATAKRLATAINTLKQPAKEKPIKTVIKIGKKDTLGNKNPIVAEVLKNVSTTDSVYIANKINMAHENDDDESASNIIKDSSNKLKKNTLFCRD